MIAQIQSTVLVIEDAVAFHPTLGDLLLLAHVRQQHIKTAPLDMPTVVAESLDRLVDLLPHRGAHVTHPASWPAAIGYAPWATNIRSNHIGNAAKFAGERPRIKLGAEVKPGGYCSRFWVQDTVPFSPRPNRPRCSFPSPAFPLSAPKATAPVSPSRAAASRNLAAKSGVERQSGHGARFWFGLPHFPLNRPPPP